MDTKTIEQAIAENLTIGIDKVLRGEIKKFETQFVTQEMCEQYLPKMGFEKSDEPVETNGWQWDWWMIFTRNGQNYTCFGTGYNGNFEFFVDEE